MARRSNQKLKVLYLLKLLLENTDEEHAMTVKKMISELDKYGIPAERKSIYDDLEALKFFGFDIVSRRTRTTEYFIANRFFQLAELKLLVDAVQCSKFITCKKSEELINKLSSFTSKHNAKLLQRQVYVADRVKTMNESIYYNVDRIHMAISQNKQISFRYFQYTVDKKKKFRKDGKRYVTSPYALSWDNENYYLITFSEKYHDFTHYRVDKMSDIEITNEPRVKLPDHLEFNIAGYSKKVFSMFGGEEETVKMQFDNSLVNVVIDRFGKDVYIEKADENSFIMKAEVVVSPTFLSWVFQFGDKVKILDPEDVVSKYKQYLTDTISIYKNIS
ncbi:MAG: WYL domain-containing protein [Tepidanaerobacteraceae bacterium]|jgi:predicted DNA-binding transcriptional regulator YafY